MADSPYRDTTKIRFLAGAKNSRPLVKFGSSLKQVKRTGGLGALRGTGNENDCNTDDAGSFSVRATGNFGQDFARKSFTLMRHRAKSGRSFTAKQSRKTVARGAKFTGKAANRTAMLTARAGAMVARLVMAVVGAVASAAASMPVIIPAVVLAVLLTVILSFFIPSAGTFAVTNALCSPSESSLAPGGEATSATGVNISDSSNTAELLQATKASPAFNGHFQPPLAKMPTPSSRVGSRVNPVTGKYQSLHEGTDYPAPAGTPIYAAASGNVIHAGPMGTCGNAVDVQHGSYGGKAYKSRYCHMSLVESTVGQQVKAGQEIGKVGTTGRSTGPHLHFGIEIDGKWIDAHPIVAGGAIPATYSAGFSPSMCADFMTGAAPTDGTPVNPRDYPVEVATVPDTRIKGKSITPRLARVRDELLSKPQMVGRGLHDVQCWDPHPHNPKSDHSRGRACDFPYEWNKYTQGKNLADGNASVQYLVNNAKRLGIKYIIWQGKIWYASTGKWKPYSSNGSAIDGHFDHFHVSVY